MSVCSYVKKYCYNLASHNCVAELSRGLLCALCVSVGLMLNACFTGVESTPKITQKEVKRQNVHDTREQHILDDVKMQPAGNWKTGKKFYVSDNRISRVAFRVEPFSMSDSLAGKTVALASVDTVPTLTDRQEIQLKFVTDNNTAEFDVRTGLTPDQWNACGPYNIPHLIDLDFVNQVKEKLVGNTYYVLPSRRLGQDGRDTLGTRYQKVVVQDVLPESESLPLKVIFSDDEGHLASLLMTFGDVTTSRRNFETLFSLTNPRTRYKQITDKNWEMIQHSKIALGMTPDECRLALGSPDTYNQIPTTAGMVERWTYTNGVYLIFEDGLLSAFRQ